MKKNIEIYTINNCPYCDAAKNLLKSFELDYKEININDDEEKRIQLVRTTGHRTVPQIFIDGKFIGGFRELKKYLADEES